MSFRSIIVERKGFEFKFGYSMRSRSQSQSDAIVEDRLVVLDGLKQSCWANMPPELLRDVLIRIEASEDSWPARKHVVACAGVCRSWREIMREIVKPPQVSGKLTFPISLKQVLLVTTIFCLFRLSRPCLASCKVPFDACVTFGLCLFFYALELGLENFIFT